MNNDERKAAKIRLAKGDFSSARKNVPPPVRSALRVLHWMLWHSFVHSHSFAKSTFSISDGEIFFNFYCYFILLIFLATLFIIGKIIDTTHHF